MQSISQPYQQEKTEPGLSGVKGSEMPKSHGKVSSMTRSEAKDNPHVITGSLMNCNSPTFMSFDFGATHSFISLPYDKTLNRQIKPLKMGY